MDKNRRTQCQRLLDVIKPSSLSDIIDAIPRFMGHIDQEPEYFYSFRNPKRPGTITRRRYAYQYYADDLIPSYTLERYLTHGRHMETLAQRLPCTCKEIATVAGHLAAVFLEKPVMRIGRVTPLYLKGKSKNNSFRHYMNSHKCQGVNRFFDASVYKSLWDEINQKSADPKTLAGFKPDDIGFSQFIDWEGWTQQSPKKRIINTTTIKHYHPSAREWEPKDYLMQINP